VPVPNLTGDWAGFAEIRRIVGSTYVGIHEGLQTGLTMQISQSGTQNGAPAVVRIRSGFLDVCAATAQQAPVHS
jgi:hypothetical protein